MPVLPGAKEGTVHRRIGQCRKLSAGTKDEIGIEIGNTPHSVPAQMPAYIPLGACVSWSILASLAETDIGNYSTAPPQPPQKYMMYIIKSLVQNGHSSLQRLIRVYQPSREHMTQAGRYFVLHVGGSLWVQEKGLDFCISTRFGWF